MTTLRNMLKSDLRQVNLILSKSFTHARLQNGLRSNRVPLCRPEFLEMYLAANPGGSFVIEKSNKIIAYCFTHLWGMVGWIGPLSVIPAEEGQGYGKKVVSASVDFLKQQGAKTIGLEMPAHSNRNLAFYTKLGFIPGKLTVDFIYKVSEQSQYKGSKEFTLTKFSKLSHDNKSIFLDKVKQFSSQFEPGLDFTNEIKITTEFGFGDACLISRADKTFGLFSGRKAAVSQNKYIANVSRIAP
ncbi:MAG: GNAT family N-acetyltransferase [bacterium]